MYLQIVPDPMNYTRQNNTRTITTNAVRLTDQSGTSASVVPITCHERSLCCLRSSSLGAYLLLQYNFAQNSLNTTDNRLVSGSQGTPQRVKSSTVCGYKTSQLGCNRVIYQTVPTCEVTHIAQLPMDEGRDPQAAKKWGGQRIQRMEQCTILLFGETGQHETKPLRVNVDPRGAGWVQNNIAANSRHTHNKPAD